MNSYKELKQHLAHISAHKLVVSLQLLPSLLLGFLGHTFRFGRIAWALGEVHVPDDWVMSKCFPNWFD